MQTCGLPASLPLYRGCHALRIHPAAIAAKSARERADNAPASLAMPM